MNIEELKHALCMIGNFDMAQEIDGLNDEEKAQILEEMLAEPYPPGTRVELQSEVTPAENGIFGVTLAETSMPGDLMVRAEGVIMTIGPQQKVRWDDGHEMFSCIRDLRPVPH